MFLENIWLVLTPYSAQSNVFVFLNVCLIIRSLITRYHFLIFLFLKTLQKHSLKRWHHSSEWNYTNTWVLTHSITKCSTQSTVSGIWSIHQWNLLLERCILEIYPNWWSVLIYSLITGLELLSANCFPFLIFEHNWQMTQRLYRTLF